MAGKFPRDAVDKLLVKCHRRCCICHRFCGTKIETDHIVQPKDGGDDRIGNAIPVCFECHAEIHSYNDEHPRGRKYRSGELRGHKDQWLRICQDNPDALVSATWDSDVGPLQALVDELEYNKAVAEYSSKDKRGALFQHEQFRRAVTEGMVAVLKAELKTTILEAYASMSRANQHILAEVNQDVKMQSQGSASIRARDALKEASPLVARAWQQLLGFLGHDAGGSQQRNGAEGQ